MTLPLLEAIGGHESLRKVTVENAKVTCTTEEQFEQLKDVIVNMAMQPQSKLTSLVFDSLSTLVQRMTDQEMSLK